MKTYGDCKKEVAQKYKLGKTLVIGHLPKYYEEAAELYAESKLLQHNVSNNEVAVCQHKHIMWINSDWRYFCLECGKTGIDSN